MGVQEAARRLLRVHWVLIVLCMVLGLGAGSAVELINHPMYSASARVLLAPAAQDSSSSEAYAAGARAVVTSPTRVAAALATIHASRDATTVANNDVSLEPLGTSSVEQVTVQDRDPHVAAALANALAQDLVRANPVGPSAGASTSAQVAHIATRLSQIDAQLKTVDGQLAQNPPPANAQQLTSLAASLIAERGSLSQQENGLLSLQPPMIVDAAGIPSTPVSTHRTLNVALGALLGLVLGLGAAALAETWRPTVASPDEIARVAGTTLLGNLRLRRRRPLTLDRRLMLRFDRAVRAQRVRSIKLVALGRFRSLDALASLLRSSGDTPPGRADGDAGVQVRPAGRFEDLAPGAGEGPTGLVLVCPAIVRRASVENVLEWSQLTEQPLVGVVTYGPPSRWRAGAKRHSVAAAGAE